MQKTFHDAVRQHAAQSLSEGEDWRQLRQIEERFDKDRQAIQQKYETEYDARVEIVRKRLIDKAGDKTFDHPSPIGTDRFNPDTINTRAHDEVQRDHARVMQQSRDNEQSAIETLQDAARRRDLPLRLAKDHFNQARDRRTGPKRRR